MSEESIIKPVYQQIAIDIANRISIGEFKVGSKIYGRSTLASQYNVSPETIRRSIVLLQDMSIVESYQGSGILVKSQEEAFKFIEKFKSIDSINSLKGDIYNLLEAKTKLDEDLKIYVNNLIDYSERFRNSSPFSPLEIEITDKCKIIGKTISEVDYWQNTGATIIGIRRNNKVILSPGPYATFMEKDVFIFIGEESSYNRSMNYLYNLD